MRIILTILLSIILISTLAGCGMVRTEPPTWQYQFTGEIRDKDSAEPLEGIKMTVFVYQNDQHLLPTFQKKGASGESGTYSLT